MASLPLSSGDDCDDEDLHAYLIIFHKYIRGFSISCHKIMAALDDIMGVRLEKKMTLQQNHAQGLRMKLFQYVIVAYSADKAWTYFQNLAQTFTIETI